MWKEVPLTPNLLSIWQKNNNNNKTPRAEKKKRLAEEEQAAAEQKSQLEGDEKSQQRDNFLANKAQDAEEEEMSMKVKKGDAKDEEANSSRKWVLWYIFWVCFVVCKRSGIMDILDMYVPKKND